MNLYEIKFTHYAPKDGKEGIVAYAIALDDESVYNWLKSEPQLESGGLHNSWNSNEEEYSEGFDIYDDDFNWIGHETYKERMIRVGGEMYDEYADVDDAYYGVTHYGWGKIKENIQDYQVTALMETIGLVVIE